ncbi:AGAP012782-PA, partial [Anopheles gambiae str. PEST]
SKIDKLPKDARTLLKTNRERARVDKIAGGKYWYNGIQQCFSNSFKNQSIHLDSILINISIDGLPL